MRGRAVAAVLLLLCAFSCSREEPQRTTPAAARQPQQPRDGGTLSRRIENDVTTLNYLLQSTDYERQVLQYLHDPLIDLDRDLKPIPGTAASWSVSPDGLTYTLKLDPRSTFSDGKPVRASDVVFTIRKVVEEQSMQFAGFFAGIDLAKLRAVDGHTVEVVFGEPNVARWYAFYIGVLPEHVYGKGDFKNDFNSTAVGNGPYTLAGREPGKSITLERRNDYWREKPHIQRIVFNVIGDHGVAWNAMKAGQIDEMRVKTDVWARVRNDPAVKSRIAFQDAWMLQYNCVAWNNRDRILKNPRVRRALAMAFDTRQVVATVYHGDARAISGPFTPDQWAYNASVPPVPFDLAGAGRLLDEAGWPLRDGKRFSLTMLVPSGNTAGVEQSQILQNALKRIGVSMEVNQLEGSAFFDSVMRGNYQAAFFAWSIDPEPDLHSLFHSSQIAPNGMNVVAYSNPQVDQAIDAARREFDPAARRAAYQRLHAMIAADQPYLWTVQFAQKWALNQRVQNVEMSNGFGLFLWHPGPKAWWLAR
jgi:peptide/nickel transport system substrate-binding protein